MQSLLLSLVPLVVFWIVEAYAPLHVALIIAMLFGVGESAYSYWRHGAVDRLTMISTLLVLVTGALSLIFHSGVLFKLKPAIFEVLFAAMLLGSYAVGRPMLVALAKQQIGEIPPSRVGYFGGVTLRMGINFLIHAGITVYAALRLSTGAWLFVKGVISYGMLGLQVAGEILYIRYILRPRWQSRDETESAPPHPEPRAR
ncbi:MAG: septation protein IspZ [Myxococcales bacterium]|nr:septation protein IspZ [Myxococcales bacterium]